MQRFILLIAVALVLRVGFPAASDQPPPPAYDPTAFALAEIDAMDVEPGDWPQFGGTSHRNNTPHGENISTEWDVETGRNILWSAELGSQSYGSPVVANGKVYIGTNNGNGYLEQFPIDIDVSCLLCFDALTGDFLWQHSSLKLPTGRVHDWPSQGISSTPYCDGDRLWYVNTRGGVCCLDAQGFYDNENDGRVLTEEWTTLNDADVIWEFDMMGELGVRQHQHCSCSCTAAGDYLIVSTSNGVDESHINIPAPDAPSLIVMHKHTSEVLWTDNSAGTNIIEGQWSSPAYGVLGGVPQVIFGGPDGWLYSFAPEGNGHGGSAVLWKFDGNSKESRHILGGRGARNYFVATPVIYDGFVYVAMGQSPEFGEGIADFWCIDPTRRGDVSPTLAVDAMGNPIPHRRVQAVDSKAGEQAVENPNSALVWHYHESDLNGDGAIDWDEEMHRTCATPVIKDDLVVFPDFSGLLHCLDAKTGESYWNYDMFSASWSSALIVENRIYVPDEEGDVTIFELSREMRVISESNLDNSIYSTPCVANDILYIANKNTLFAIANPR